MQNNSYSFWRRAAARALMLLYIAVLSKFVLFKQSPNYVIRELRKDFTAQRIKNNLRYSNFSPMRTVALYLRSNLPKKNIIANVGGNVVGFMPFGFLLPNVIRYFRRKRRIVFAGLIFSLGFELSQLLTGLGRFDVDDLILNTFGTLLGYLCYKLLRYSFKYTEIKNPAVSGTL